MKEKMVRCTRCQGSGRIPFNGIIADTWELLRKQKEEVTGVFLSQVAQCKATAMNNRLRILASLGLAEVRKYGRIKLYKAKEPSDEAQGSEG